MGSTVLEFLGTGNIPKALIWVTEKLSAFAASIKIPALVMFILGALVAAFIGAVGYKCVKLVCAAGLGAVGYAIGYALVNFASGRFGWKIPGFVGIIVGFVLLDVLGFLAFKKFAFALYGVIGVTVFVVTYFMFSNYVIALAIAIVVAMLSLCAVRWATIITTSFIGGFTLIAMIWAAIPQFEALNFNAGITGEIIAIVASVAFMVIQLVSTKPAKKVAQGPKRVKIRRVFDGW